MTTGGLLYVLNKFASALQTIANSENPFTNMAEGIKSLVSSVTGAIDEAALRLKSEALKSFAIAIAILVAAVAVLATMDPDRVAFAVGVIGSLTVALGFLGKMSAGIDPKSLTNSFAATALALALSVLIVASAVKKLGDLDTDQLVRGTAAVTAIMGAMTFMAGKLPKTLPNISLASQLDLVG